MARGETVITREDLRALLEYSTTLPTGTIVGKRWRRNTAVGRRQTGVVSEWLIGEYVDIGKADEIGIVWTWAVVRPGEPHRGDLR